MASAWQQETLIVLVLVDTSAPGGHAENPNVDLIPEAPSAAAVVAPDAPDVICCHTVSGFDGADECGLSIPDGGVCVHPGQQHHHEYGGQ